MKSADSKSVVFVAEPESAPPARAHSYARPDDMFDAGKSWREALLEYNRSAKSNPLGLYPAYRLYKNQIYERLVDRLGLNNVYLSADVGLFVRVVLFPMDGMQHDGKWANGGKQQSADVGASGDFAVKLQLIERFCRNSFGKDG
jgi:hypothetical protein